MDEGPARLPVHAYGALLSVQLLFGMLPVLGKMGLGAFDTGTFAILRVVGGMLLLVATATLAVGMRPLPREDVPRFALFGLLGVALNQGLFLAGLSRTTAINAVILVATIPVFTYLVALVAGRERRSGRRAAGILVALLGILVIVDPRRFETDRSVMLGNLMLLANSASYAVYLVVSKPVAERYRSLEFIAWVFAFGAPLLVLGFLPTLPGSPGAGVAGRAWLALAVVIVGPTFGTYALNAYALRRVPSTTVAAFVYVQPVVTAVLAAVFLGERIQLRHAVAAALVLAGVTLVARRGRVAAPAA